MKKFKISQRRQSLGGGKAIMQDGQLLYVNTPDAPMYVNGPNGSGIGSRDDSFRDSGPLHLLGTSRRLSKKREVVTRDKKPFLTYIHTDVEGVSLKFFYEYKSNALTFLGQDDYTVTLQKTYFEDEGLYILAWSERVPNIDSNDRVNELVLNNTVLKVRDEAYLAFNFQNQPVYFDATHQYTSDNKFCHRMLESYKTSVLGVIGEDDYDVIRGTTPGEKAEFDERVKVEIKAAISADAWNQNDTSTEYFDDMDVLDNVFDVRIVEATYKTWYPSITRRADSLGFPARRDGWLMTPGPYWTLFRVRPDFATQNQHIIDNEGV